MVDLNKSFFNKTYDELYPKVTGYIIAKCNNIGDVEDISQEVFAELYNIIIKKGADYIENPEALAMQITKSKLFRHYKFFEKIKRLVPLVKTNDDGEEYETALCGDIDIEDSYINKETIYEVKEILNNKPLEIQKIFMLYYYSGRTIKGISEDLNASESFVKHKLYRTLEEIRVIYRKEGMKI